MTDIKIPEGFTPHDGKGRSIPGNTRVQVIFDGDEFVWSYWPGFLPVKRWNWANENVEDGLHIIAYRVIQP